MMLGSQYQVHQGKHCTEISESLIGIIISIFIIIIIIIIQCEQVGPFLLDDKNKVLVRVQESSTDDEIYGGNDNHENWQFR